MARELLCRSPEPEKEEKAIEIEHTYTHEVESWYYVLLFAVLGYGYKVPRKDPLKLWRKSSWATIVGLWKEIHFDRQYAERYKEIAEAHSNSLECLKRVTFLFVNADRMANNAIGYLESGHGSTVTLVQRWRIRHDRLLSEITYRSFGKEIGLSEEVIEHFDDPVPQPNKESLRYHPAFVTNDSDSSN